jgi:UDP-N-acetylglucosamine 4,6-dehydratase
MIKNKTILIIGGTGSLGLSLIKRYIKYNTLWIYSRDESKHWKINIDLNNDKNINFIIGDIRDLSKISQTIKRINPEIIILAAALKHIDKCEYEINESIETNLIGTKNLLDSIEKFINVLTKLETVCFISTDKACSPVNAYGMCKAISEKLMVEKSKFIPKIKFVTVRYGNVLNSRGSIIPILHTIGQNPNINTFKITDSRMTRFIMTLEQSVDLIEYAILNGESGDIIIPKLISMHVKDLINIFSEMYNKPIEDIGLRAGEKLLESLINETQSYNLKFNDDNEYMHIKPPHNCHTFNKNLRDYNSTINPLSYIELKEYLTELGLLDINNSYI